ncbi:MAG: GNAT family N-acetyltransferase [Pseudomonadota bacterium]
MDVARIDPLHPDARLLIAGSEAEQSAFYPPEHRYAFSPEELVAGDIRFFLGRAGDAPAVCGGYGSYGAYAELKRVYVAPAHRGQGWADALIAACEAGARAEGLALMCLETGEASPAALKVYARLGYARRGPFGPYAENGSSVFMEKAL